MSTASALLVTTLLAASSGLDARQSAAIKSINENLPKVRQRLEEGTSPDLACAGLTVNLRRLEGSLASEAVQAQAQVRRLCNVEGPMKYAQVQLAKEEAQPSLQGKTAGPCFDVNHVLDRLDPTDEEVEKDAGPLMQRFNDVCARKAVEAGLDPVRKARASKKKEDLKPRCLPVYLEVKKLALDRRPPTRKLVDEVHKLCADASLADAVQFFLGMDPKSSREQTPRSYAAICAFTEDSISVLERKKHAKVPELKKLAAEKCVRR
jgi:hypothetical protein